MKTQNTKKDGTHVKYIINLLTLILFLCSATALGAENKKFPCPGVPKNTDTAKSRGDDFFKNGAESEQKGDNYGALERYLCSLKMNSNEKTFSKVEQLSFAVEPRKDAVKLLIKFKNRNKNNESVQDVKILIDTLNNPDAKPPAPAEASIDTTEPAPETTPNTTKKEKQNYDNVAAGPVDNTTELNNDSSQKTMELDEDSKLKDVEVATKIHSDEDGISPKNKKLRAGGITATIIGGVLLGLGATSHVLSFKSKDKALDSVTYPKYLYYEQKMNNQSAGAYTAYLFGVAGIITGIVLIMKSKKKDDQKNTEFGDSLSVKIDAGPTGFSIAGTF
ncbi:MAG: hypothetical protein JXR91_05650 [Deltaproteobacteria bacterium]|nr:hypothetical protein [Deltaproteobacteria bacterium]